MPEAEEKQESKQNGATDKGLAGITILLLILPTLTWLMFCFIAVTWLAGSLSIWLAAPLGLVIGSIICFVAVVVFGDGPKTLIELNVGCAILFLMSLFLYPVFTKAREKARQAAVAKAQNHARPVPKNALPSP